MEPQFICEYMPTVKKLASQTRRHRPGRVAIFTLIGIVIFLITLQYAMRFQFQGFWLAYFLFGVVYLLWSVLMPEIYAIQGIKRAQKSMGTYPICTIAFGDEIEITEGSIRIIWQYSEINWVKRYKYTYVLAKDKRMGITLDPDSFIKGSFEDFKRFLHEKRPDLVIPD